MPGTGGIWRDTASTSRRLPGWPPRAGSRHAHPPHDRLEGMVVAVRAHHLGGELLQLAGRHLSTAQRPAHRPDDAEDAPVLTAQLDGHLRVPDPLALRGSQRLAPHLDDAVLAVAELPLHALRPDDVRHP